MLRNWLETIVYLMKLLFMQCLLGIVFLFEKRDEHRMAVGKDPILPLYWGSASYFILVLRAHLWMSTSDDDPHTKERCFANLPPLTVIISTASRKEIRIKYLLDLHSSSQQSLILGKLGDTILYLLSLFNRWMVYTGWVYHLLISNHTYWREPGVILKLNP